MVLNPPDVTPTYATASPGSRSATGAVSSLRARSVDAATDLDPEHGCASASSIQAASRRRRAPRASQAQAVEPAGLRASADDPTRSALTFSEPAEETPRGATRKAACRGLRVRSDTPAVNDATPSHRPSYGGRRDDAGDYYGEDTRKSAHVLQLSPGDLEPPGGTTPCARSATAPNRSPIGRRPSPSWSRRWSLTTRQAARHHGLALPDVLGVVLVGGLEVDVASLEPRERAARTGVVGGDGRSAASGPWGRGAAERTACWRAAGRSRTASRPSASVYARSQAPTRTFP